MSKVHNTNEGKIGTSQTEDAILGSKKLVIYTKKKKKTGTKNNRYYDDSSCL